MTTATIPAEAVQKLRTETQAGMLDCRKALIECGGDFEKARDHLRKKGLAAVAKRAERAAEQGAVASYIHHGGKIGVLVEVRCETDFVARTDEFQRLGRTLAMQIAVAKPRYLRREEVPADVIERERAIYAEQAAATGKPAPVIEKIVAGKVEKFFGEVCFLEQEFLISPESDAEKVSDYITEVAAKLGEKVEVAKFSRLEIGS